MRVVCFVLLIVVCAFGFTYGVFALTSRISKKMPKATSRLGKITGQTTSQVS